MTTKNYFIAELHVHFTCSELHTIMSALADLSSSELSEGRKSNSLHAWNLRNKVKQFVSLYESSAVL